MGSPAFLTIAANNIVKAQGMPLPELTASYNGFVNGDGPSSLTTPVSLATTATPSSIAGSYAIIASGASSPDYTISYVNGVLTVPSSLTSIPDPETVVFVTTLYREVLGREPEPFGLAYLLQRLATDATPAEVSRGFFASLERRTLQAQHQAPKISQPKALADALRAGQLTDFPVSDRTDPGAIGFVTTLYREVLSREPEPYGLAYWLQRLATDATPAEVSRGFFASLERRTLQAKHQAPNIKQPSALADALRGELLADVVPAVLANPGPIALVTTLYREILDRDPEPSGEQYWLERLAIGATSAVVAVEIDQSPEHRTLRHRHEAPKISELNALSDALKAERKAMRIGSSHPDGPMNSF